jgi:hypothetical protein
MNRARPSFLTMSLVLALTVFCPTAPTQNAAGRIFGTVTDQSGAAIGGATITVSNEDTHREYRAATGSDGFYQVLLLPIGTYSLTAEKNAFQTMIFQGQVLQINQSLRIDVHLRVGPRTEVVHVNEQANIIETINPTIGNSITGRTLLDAPLNGRSTLDLALLVSGVTPTNPEDGGGTYNIAGGRSDSITYLLDGGNNNDLLGNLPNYNPNPDSVAEFRILKSGYTAEYGRNAGGVISVVTKSGTNDWHGSAYDFARNDALDANRFFNKNNPDPTQNLPRNVLKRHQYGATFGGPITIPHVVRGKDRFFFFVAYEGQRQITHDSTNRVETFSPLEITGNFSQSGQPGSGQPPNCSSADPAVASFLQSNPFFQTDPSKAACAIIDPTRINSVAQKYITAGLIPTGPSGILNTQSRSTLNKNELTMKFDLNITDKDKLGITLGGNRVPQFLGLGASGVPGAPTSGTTNAYFSNFNYSRTLRSNLINEFRATVQRSLATFGVTAVSNFKTPADLGINIHPDEVTAPPILVFYDHGLGVGFTLFGPSEIADTTFAYSDVLTWEHGVHTWKFGGGFSAYRFDTKFDTEVDGAFIFAGAGNPQSSGNDFADFLFGLPTAYSQGPSAPTYARTKYTHAFLQDEWRARKNLTFTFGIRYEYSTPRTDKFGNTFSLIPGQQSKVFTNAPVGLTFPGDPDTPRGLNFPDRNDWAPRVGFAWAPFASAKTSVRGGFGVFYDILKLEDSLQFNGQPPFFASANLSFPALAGNPTADLPFLSDPYGSSFPATADPFPSKRPSPVVDFSPFLPFGNQIALIVVDWHLRTPYTYQYTLDVEREVAKNTKIDASYVGSSSHGLTSLVDANPIVLGTTDRVLNLYPGNRTCSVDFATGNSIGVCTYANLFELKNLTKASFNSLEISLEKQLSNSSLFGTTYVHLAYTYSHSIDNTSGFRNRNSSVPSYQPHLFRASSDFDLRERIVLSGGWDLPLGRFATFLPHRLTQGWSIYPIFSWRTGSPFDIFALVNGFGAGNQYAYPGPSAAGDLGDIRANVVGPTGTLDPHRAETLTNPTIGNTVTGNYYFNPASFSIAQCPNPSLDPSCMPSPLMFPSDSQAVANPSVRTYGTLPRNFLRVPGQTNLDMSFAKATSVFHERVNLEIRADFFNILNHTEFANPIPAVTSQFFGQVINTYDPRIIQLAARLKF